MPKLTPIGDRVLAVRDEEVAEMAGLIVDVGAREKPTWGVVKAVGPGRWEGGAYVPLQITVGDRIAFGKYSGTEITLEDGEPVVVLRHDEVLVVERSE